MTVELAYATTGDGRQLEYYTAGAVDGLPLLFQVGTPNCAAEYSVLTQACTALGLRLICYSRPGYAGSTPLPGRSVADAVADTQRVLDAVGVGQFLAAGWSGGGPHALACAALLPERCLGAAVIAGVAPHDAAGLDFLAGMDSDNVAEFSAALAGVDELAALLEPLAAQFATVTGESVVAGLQGLLSAVDRAALTGRLAADMAANFRLAVGSGMAGWRDDDLAFVKDWGFRPADIALPVAVWQGAQDRMVPFAHGQWLAAEIPTAQAHLFEPEGHVSLIAQAGRILADLQQLVRPGRG
jgi:pimeloyl-ACP methyl ester carboxylesterase